MSRLLATLLALLIALSVIAVAPPVDATTTHVQIQSVETSISQPAPGDRITITTRIANLASSTEPVEVTDVFVRRAGTSRTKARIRDVGTIAPGGTINVPLTTKFNSPGGKRLTVAVVVRNETGAHRRVNYPLYVEVERPDEAVISFADLQPIAGQERAVNVTVSNGDVAGLSNVRLELQGNASIENPERVQASIAAGTQVTHEFSVRFPEEGQRSLRAAVTYTTSEGSTRTISRSVAVDVEPAMVDPRLTAETEIANGSTAVRVALQQFGNVELRDVEVRVLRDGRTIERAALRDVPADGKRSASLAVSGIEAGRLRAEASFEAAGERRSANVSLSFSPAPTAAIELTGVDVSREGSILTVSGDVANVGTADASAIVVALEETAAVTPVNPRKEFFVGRVDASEFATFELTANASASVEAVPVEIRYTVDGQRRAARTMLDVRAVTPAEDESAGGFPFGTVLVAAVVLLVVAVGLFGWFRR